MELMIVCGIVVAAGAIVIVRVVRALNRTHPTCCHCDSCPQLDSMKEQCCNDASSHAQSDGSNSMD